ncbi:ribonuclease D [Parvularcula dongshanensis]|uniref:Ribonuclease D n=1 Tax=Parvularcula dongshanensis TaxID=1173995 RepID=A0A840I5Z4_9PROT|nr:ribonuclease D [Parvularcula dongshanensis]MBB4659832.1 ribonuclease D [Parvularcula dongshanensis]
MQVISDTQSLRDLCARLATHDFVTVDTEFMREKTYYAKLCLIQAASTDEAAIIDPLAEGIDLSPFLDLLADESTLKVFHAARQDLEIFYKLMGEVPAPLFDTQVAAMACGYGDQIGYEPLVRQVTSGQVDKGSRFTDWAQRPLSSKQLTYALGDVTHLVDVYLKLARVLDESGRGPWVAEEMEALRDEQLYFTEPDEAWRRLKLRGVRPREVGPLMKLAAWREAEAQEKDLPRARVLKDEVLFEVARAAPEDEAALGRLRSIPQGFERSNQAKAILQAVAEGKSLPRDELPDLRGDGPRQPAPADVVDLLRVLLKRQSEKHGVAPRLLASSADLEAIALDDDADVPALRGWRRQVFGDLALRLKSGELGMTLNGKQITLIERRPAR